MKYYRMRIENARTGEVKTHVSPKQGSAPAGWTCKGVLGFFETPGREEEPRRTVTRGNGYTTTKIEDGSTTTAFIISFD